MSAVGAARRGLAASALLACAAMQAHAQAQAGSPPPPLPEAEVVRRASEAGAWWAVAQTACEPAEAQSLLSAVNRALFHLSARPVQITVIERFEDPHLDEPVRLRMEGVMRRAAALRAEVFAPRAPGGGEGRPAGPTGIPATPAAERELAALCARSSARLRATLLDPPGGLLPALR